MKQKALVRLLLLLMMQQLSQFVTAQNVGIGTNAPTGPLSFANTLGNKLVLWGNGNNAHYGIGVQSGLLQVYADAASANIGFGYGSSSSFNERMRILNNGNYDGMLLNGRLLIKNGSNDPIGGGGGVWLYKADNSALLGFMGTQNNQNIGFYGGPGGWGFTYDAINSRVGIGNPNPNAPLTFAAVGGKKIVLYPGTVGDAGFGIAPNRLQIFSDNPNADVAIGYDAAGVFNERFAVKPNGAIAFGGNTGQAGQMLVSKGNTQAPVWIPKPTAFFFTRTSSPALEGSNLCTDINGINGQVFSLQVPAIITYQLSVPLYASNGVLGSSSVGAVVVQVVNESNQVVSQANAMVILDNYKSQHYTVTGVGDLAAGNYSVRAKLVRSSTTDGTLYLTGGPLGSSANCNDMSIYPGQLIIQVFPK